MTARTERGGRHRTGTRRHVQSGRPRHQALITGVTGATLGALGGVALLSVTPVPGVSDPGALVLVAVPLVRAMLHVAAVATIGLSLLPLLFVLDRPKLTEPVLRPARRAAIASATVWAACALATLVLQTAESVGPGGTVTAHDVGQYVTHVVGGQALVITAALALACGGLNAYGPRVPDQARLGLALFALLPLPMTGHAAKWAYYDYSMVTIQMHVGSAALWAGGLGALAVLLSGHRALLAHALPRFSTVATWCIVAAGASGLYVTAVQLSQDSLAQFLDGLFGTTYGWLVLGKLACIGSLALFGAKMRLHLLPRISARRPTAFATWAAAEVAVMGVTFGLAAVLARTSPM